MRIRTIAIIAAVLALAGCSNTIAGAKCDLSGIFNTACLSVVIPTAPVK